jgi:hypothetical protein
MNNILIDDNNITKTLTSRSIWFSILLLRKLIINQIVDNTSILNSDINNHLYIQTRTNKQIYLGTQDTTAVCNFLIYQCKMLIMLLLENTIFIDYIEEEEQLAINEFLIWIKTLLERCRVDSVNHLIILKKQHTPRHKDLRMYVMREITSKDLLNIFNTNIKIVCEKETTKEIYIKLQQLILSYNSMNNANDSTMLDQLYEQILNL